MTSPDSEAGSLSPHGERVGARDESPRDSVVVLGAGPAGLAVAACLKQRGRRCTILEAAEAVGSSWRNHYARLHLHTVKEHSSLPGLPFEASEPRYVPRAGVVDYLERYASHHGLAPRFGERVRRLTRAGGGWEVETSVGLHRASDVVVATGYNRVPHEPSFEGASSFEGEVIHSRAYRSGEPYRGRRVLVVGLGNTGGEIALDLLEHGAKPALSVRSPVNVVPRDFLGTPTQITGLRLSFLPRWAADRIGRLVSRMAFGNLEPYGIRTPSVGPMSGIYDNRRIPLIDVGTVAAIKRGEIAVYPNVQALTPTGARFADGRSAELDAIVYATGYRPGLDELLGDCAAIGSDGYPRAPTGDVPGLHFVGFSNVSTGLLRQIGIDAETVASAITEAG